MEYRIIVNGPVYIEAVANTEDERREVVKGIQYTLKDLGAWDEPKPEKKRKSVKDLAAPVPPALDKPALATDKQRAFMDKLGLQYDPNITMVEASDLIREWKSAHGYQN